MNLMNLRALSSFVYFLTVQMLPYCLFIFTHDEIAECHHWSKTFYIFSRVLENCHSYVEKNLLHWRQMYHKMLYLFMNEIFIIFVCVCFKGRKFWLFLFIHILMRENSWQELNLYIWYNVEAVSNFSPQFVYVLKNFHNVIFEIIQRTYKSILKWFIFPLWISTWHLTEWNDA